MVKAWEPPLMEFIDFLNTLRAVLPERSCPIVVLPVGLGAALNSGAAPGQMSPTPTASTVSALPQATTAQLTLWRNKLAGVGDPWLRVAANAAEVWS